VETRRAEKPAGRGLAKPIARGSTVHRPRSQHSPPPVVKGPIVTVASGCERSPG
jgi:hypothetical protein